MLLPAHHKHLQLSFELTPIRVLTLSYPFYLQGGGCNRETGFHAPRRQVVAAILEMFRQRVLAQKMLP